MNGSTEYTTTATLESLGLTPTPPERLTGVVVGILTGFNNDGEPIVSFEGTECGLQRPARSTVSLEVESVGREVALMFEDGDADRPLVIGLIQYPKLSPAEHDQKSSPLGDAAVVVDGKRTVIKAEDEIELRCGQSSIVLTKAGKVIIRGAYLLSRSSGVNRIKGGSVQIN